MKFLLTSTTLEDFTCLIANVTNQLYYICSVSRAYICVSQLVTKFLMFLVLC